MYGLEIRRWTCAVAADPDLSGVPASIVGLDPDNNFVLAFDNGSALAISIFHLRECPPMRYDPNSEVPIPRQPVE